MGIFPQHALPRKESFNLVLSHNTKDHDLVSTQRNQDTNRRLMIDYGDCGVLAN